MKVVGTKSVEGLVVLTSVDGKAYLHIDMEKGPSVVHEMEEASPMPEPTARKLLKAITESYEVFIGFPEVESFLARAVVRRIEAQLVVVDVSDEVDELEAEDDNGEEITEEDLSPTRVLH